MTRTLSSIPIEDGFHLPAETVPHAKAWLLWPEREDVWRDGARPAQEAFARVAQAIAETEPVTVGASRAQLQNARTLLPRSVRVIELESNDAWMRDVAPSFVADGKGGLRGVHWRFNAWGGLYSNWNEDERVAPRMLEHERLLRYEAPLVLEGGAIHVDGDGTLITTETCLLDKKRNPDLSKVEVERLLKSYLGVATIIWLRSGLCEDETGGHIDNLACFAQPGLVLLAWTDDSADPQHVVVQDALARLEKARDARGKNLEIVKIALPPPLFRSEEEARGVTAQEGTWLRKAGDLLPASYINFYVANGAVIMPSLHPATDETARAIVTRVFPGRVVKAVAARELLLGGGGIHCITREQPLGSSQI